MLALDSSAVVDHVEMPATEQQREAERDTGRKREKGREREREGETLSEIRLTFSIKSRLAAASFDVAGCRDYSS